MKKQVVVIGLGRFGVSVATTLYSMGHDVLALDKEEKNVLRASSQLTRAIQADATDEVVLKELGIADFDVAIVAIGSAIESSVLSTILLKRLGVRYVIARAENDLHGSILQKIGADNVVYPEREMGVRTAHGMTLRDVSDYMAVAQGYGIAKLPVFSHLVGKKLSDLGFGPKGKWEVAVFLIQRNNGIIVGPSLEEVINAGDALIVAGNDDEVEKLLSAAKKNKKED